MAHGSPRIVTCDECGTYIWVARFSHDPDCPTCKSKSRQTTKQELKEQYHLGLFYDFKFNFERWEKIKVSSH